MENDRWKKGFHVKQKILANKSWKQKINCETFILVGNVCKFKPSSNPLKVFFHWTDQHNRHVISISADAWTQQLRLID